MLREMDEQLGGKQDAVSSCAVKPTTCHAVSSIDSCDAYAKHLQHQMCKVDVTSDQHEMF